MILSTQYSSTSTGATMPRLPSLNPLKPFSSLLAKMTTPPPPPESFTEITEGLAKSLHPPGKVFYNPAQVVNRDLSLLLLRHHIRTTQKPLRILEALSASGLRSIRYFKETPPGSIESILANDLDPTAVDSIRRNVTHNGLDDSCEVIPNCDDAIAVMARHMNPDKQFAFIDLDPYGSAAPFLESAIRALQPDGLLAVTCTDLAVLCGNSPEICYARYGATPLKGAFAHELAVRIVLQAIHAAANRQGRAVVPLLCVKIDFYVRLFVRVVDSRSMVQKSASRTGLISCCVGCASVEVASVGKIREVVATGKRKRRRVDGVETEENGEKKINLKYTPASVEMQPMCKICGGRKLLGGPIWKGPLIEEGIAKSLLDDLESCTKTSQDKKGEADAQVSVPGRGVFRAADRVAAIIRLTEEEVDVPLFHHLPTMCATLKAPQPPAASVRTFLEKRGYKVSQSHTDAVALKTDAPIDLIWDVLRLWVKKRGLEFGKKRKRDDAEGEDGKAEKETRVSPRDNILAAECGLKEEDIDFAIKKDRFVRRGMTTDLGVRFPHNPERNWGPKARAGRNKISDQTANGT